MPAVIPPMRFAPDETPWARWAQENITTLLQDRNARNQNENNVNQGQNATVARLGENIAALEELARQAVLPVTAMQSESGFAVTISFTDRAITTISVPTGFTQAVISVTALAGLSNTGSIGSSANLRLQSRIRAVPAGAVTQSIDSGKFGTATFVQSLLVTGLNPGDAIVCTTQIAFFGTSASTFATTSATALFLV